MATTAARKELPARHSRGTRIRQLVGEEAEADESFWGQAAWNEDEQDDDYSTEDEEEDVVDSDFDDDENPDEDVHDQEADDDRAQRRRSATQRTGVYREPVKQVTRSTLLKTARRTGATAVEQSDTVAHGRPPTPPPVFQYEAPTVRRSTARKSSVSSELRKRATAEAALRTRRHSDTPRSLSTGTQSQASQQSVAPPLRFTQAQLLAEAVRTEVENVQSLSRLEQLEEEKRVESLAPKAPFTGHMVRYHSRIGMPKTITFLNAVEFPALFHSQTPAKRARPTQPDDSTAEEDDDDDDDDGNGEAEGAQAPEDDA